MTIVRVSASGKTIWTRFVSVHSMQRYGRGPYRWERNWKRGRAYRSLGHALFGTVVF